MKSATWSFLAVSALNAIVQQTCRSRGACSVMLTGGRSAEILYKTWSESLMSNQLLNIDFYFGDERCVPPNHPDSNYGLVKRTFFRNELPRGVRIHRIEAESSNADVAAEHYAASLPKLIDVLLLSMGDDGHVASLFPNSAALRETDRKVVHIVGPTPPFHRLTITPPVIQIAREIFVFAIGKAKRDKYKEALTNPKDITSIPARMVLHGNWIFGSEGGAKLCLER